MEEYIKIQFGNDVLLYKLQEESSMWKVIQLNYIKNNINDFTTYLEESMKPINCQWQIDITPKNRRNNFIKASCEFSSAFNYLQIELNKKYKSILFHENTQKMYNDNTLVSYIQNFSKDPYISNVIINDDYISIESVKMPFEECSENWNIMSKKILDPILNYNADLGNFGFYENIKKFNDF